MSNENEYSLYTFLSLALFAAVKGVFYVDPQQEQELVLPQHLDRAIEHIAAGLTNNVVSQYKTINDVINELEYMHPDIFVQLKQAYLNYGKQYIKQCNQQANKTIFESNKGL